MIPVDHSSAARPTPSRMSNSTIQRQRQGGHRSAETHYKGGDNEQVYDECDKRKRQAAHALGRAGTFGGE